MANGPWNRGPLRGQDRRCFPGAWFPRLNETEQALAPIFDVPFTTNGNDVVGSISPAFTRASSAYGTSVSGGVMTLVNFGTNELRVGSYRDANGVTKDGAWIEGAATNLLINTDGLSGTGWTAGNDVSNNSGVSTTEAAPDTSKFAYELIGKNLTGGILVAPTGITVTSGTDYCVSVFYKEGELAGKFLYLQALGLTGFNDAYVYFSSTDGSIGTTGPQTLGSGVIDYGNGWRRAWMHLRAGANNANARFRFWYTDADGATAGTGDDSSVGLYLFGAQVEVGTYPSSYITSGSAATTRAADSALIYSLGSALSGPYTVDVECHRGVSGLLSSPLGLEAANDNNIVRVITNAGDDSWSGQVRRAGSLQANMNAGIGTFVSGEWQRISLAAASNDFELYVDGTSVATDTSGTPTESLGTVSIGQDTLSGSAPWGGFVGRVRIYDLRLSDAEVAAL